MTGGGRRGMRGGARRGLGAVATATDQSQQEEQEQQEPAPGTGRDGNGARADGPAVPAYPGPVGAVVGTDAGGRPVLDGPGPRRRSAARSSTSGGRVRL